MNTYATALAVMLASVVAVESSFACSCYPSNLEQNFERSPFVFTAVIVSVEFVECLNKPSKLECTDYEAGFDVTKVFKGNIPFTVIKSHVGGATCGMSLTVGQEYLFFTDDSGSVSLCSGNINITRSNEHKLQQLKLIEDYTSGKTPDLSSP